MFIHKKRNKSEKKTSQIEKIIFTTVSILVCTSSDTKDVVSLDKQWLNLFWLDNQLTQG